MFDLGDVLQFVIDSFYDGSLSGKQPVRHAHQCAFHVVLEFCYQLDTIDEKALKQFLTDISLISNKFTVQELHKGLVLKWLSVINVARSNHEVKHFSLLIADEV